MAFNSGKRAAIPILSDGSDAGHVLVAKLGKMVDQGFLLRGYEIEARDGVIREHLQGWWCKPAG